MKEDNKIFAEGVMFAIGFCAVIPSVVIYALTQNLIAGYALLVSGLLIVVSVIMALVGGLKKYRWEMEE